jgi:aminopeptidase YwaD
MILLLHGPICSEQLMPKNFVFYNPEHHQEVVHLLEKRNPAAIITATAQNPEQVGALNPFPLIVDGDFNLPSVYCREAVGDVLEKLQGASFRLHIKAERFPSKAANVIATRNGGLSKRKVVLTAHIDAYENTPGALDNASGTVVLLLVAEMLFDYEGDYALEIAALNGEDHYSAGGQLDYIIRYQEGFSSIAVAVNIDNVGYVKGRSSYSFYGCTKTLERRIRDVFRHHDGLVEGEPWFSGDHMIFLQRGRPSIAITAEHMPELMRTVTHTSVDTPDLVDACKLVEVADALDDLVRSL